VFLLESQPWPIGRGGGCELMLGCIAIATDETIIINYDEMEDVRWFSIAEAKEFVNYHKTKTNEPIVGVASLEVEGKPSVFIPGPYAIAFHLIDQYVKLYDLEHHNALLSSSTAAASETANSSLSKLFHKSNIHSINRILNTILFPFLSGTLIGSILTALFLLKAGSIRKFC